jgi:hypothetical protein
MNNENEYTFRTKTGVCTVSPSRLVLTRRGVVGKAAQATLGNSIYRVLIINGILGIAALVYGIWSLIDNNVASGLFFCIIGVFLLLNVILSRNNSVTGFIERSTVKSVEAHPPRPPFTRGYFIIHFLHNSKEHKRMVMLPGSLSGGNAEYPKALAIMKKTGWLE